VRLIGTYKHRKYWNILKYFSANYDEICLLYFLSIQRDCNKQQQKKFEYISIFSLFIWSYWPHRIIFILFIAFWSLHLSSLYSYNNNKIFFSQDDNIHSFSISVTPYLLPVGVDSSLFFHFYHPLSSVVWCRRFSSFFLFSIPE